MAKTIKKGNQSMSTIRRKGFFSKLVQYKEYLLMLLPAVLFFTVFSYLPMSGLIVAFKRYTYDLGIFGSQWIGLENFRFLFLNGDLLRVIRNTLGYNLAFIIVNNLLEIFIAIVLVELGNKYFRKVTQTFMFLPYFISWVVVGAFAYNLFNYEHGFVNSILTSFNNESIDFYSNPAIWIPIIIILCAWKSVGYGTVIYLAAIMGIDSEMFEAAEIDGANVFQRIFRIILPCLKPTVIILVLLSLGNIFRGDFSMFYQLIGDNSLLWTTTDVIDTFVTRSLLQTNEIGMSVAAGLFQSVFGFLAVTSVNFLVKLYDKDYSLF